MNEVLANNSHRLFVVTDVRCPWLMSVCRSQDTNVHISVLQWRRFAWDEQLINWDNVKAEWMIGIHNLQETCQFGNLKLFQLAIYKCIWSQSSGLFDFVIFAFEMFESPLTRCREGQHLLVLANPRRKPESVIFAAAKREWFEMSVNAESPSSMIQFGKKHLWSRSETRGAKQTSWQSWCNLVALKNLDDALR